VDLLRPYLGDVDRLVDLTPSTVDMRPHLLLPDGIEYEAVASPTAVDRPIAQGSMAIVSLGPDPALHGRPDDAVAVVDRLGPGGRALLLFGWDPSELPYRRLLEPLARNSCQVLQATVLDRPPIRAAAIVERIDRLVPPRDATGEPISPAPRDAAERLALEIRLANEWAFGDLVSSALRQDPGGSGGAAGRGLVGQERLRWQRQIDERDARIRKLETTVDRLERSGSLRVGRLLVVAGRSPRSAVRLPIDLFRLWRTRES
jgi:hypothetical protein